MALKDLVTIRRPRVGQMVICVNPPIESDRHRRAPGVVTEVNDLIINCHVFQNEAPAVIALELPHKSVRGAIVSDPYWEWDEPEVAN